LFLICAIFKEQVLDFHPGEEYIIMLTHYGEQEVSSFREILVSQN
jgi:hypothetical protein